MGFSYNKAIEIRPQKERALSTFFVAFLVSCAVLIPYIFANGDFFKAAAEKGIEQLGMFFLTPAELSKYYFPFGTVGFVVGAPVGLLAELIPASALQYAGAASMALRISLSALFAYFFIRRFTRTPEAARLGAFLYAFSSAVIGIVANNALQNLVVIFPLILLAAEKLITESRRVWLAVAVMGAVLLNGYAALPLIMFLMTYVILRITSRDVKVDFSRVFGVFFEIIIGALSAAILLIPVVVVNVVHTFNPQEYMGMDALFYTGKVYLSLLKSFFLPAESVNNALVSGSYIANEGLFGTYLPLLSMSGVIAYCGAKKGSGFKRIVVLSIVCLCIPALNNVFSLFNTAAGYMWLYMPALIFSLVSVMAFENREIPLGSGIKWSVALTLIVSAVIMAFPKMSETGLTFGFFETDSQVKSNLIRFGIYAGVALLGLIAVAIILKAAEKRDKTMFNALFICTVLFSAAILWLYVATEVYYFKSSLISNYGGTLSDVLTLAGIDIAKILYISMIVSVTALGALAVYIIICIATHKKRRETEFEYPEGEELLDLWRQYDEEEAEEYETEEEDFSLDSIAESLQMEYPVNVDPDEFKGGFNIVAEIPEKNGEKDIDSKQ